ncbi:MAG: glycoside hydrolase family 172 protein [Ktedonobacteraceae bacterium]
MLTQRRLSLFSRLLCLALSLFMGCLFASMHTPTARAAATEPYGLSALTSLDRLPYLKLDTMAGGQSSFDRSGGNGDSGNFLYTDSNGDNVMLDLKGPGTVYRLWVTGFASNATIKVYFDGSTTPQINMLLSHLFDGSTPPFLPPLVATNAASSGGFVSYVPLPFHSSIKVTTNGSFYYNIGYHMYSPDTNITTWSSSQDPSAAQAEWNQAYLGRDPKSTSGNTVTAGTVNLASGATQPVLDIAGPQQIQSIKLHIPDVVASPPSAPYTDNGRAHKGTSQFTMALNPANQGVNLTRRLDYGIGNQKATVSVNGQQVGTWFTSGSDTTNRWRDNTFSIPSSFTANQSSITITITFVSSDVDWNEFYYWAYSIVGGNNTLTDSLDVGNTTSESAHHYTITAQTWSGSPTFTYPPTANPTDSGRAHKGTSQFSMALNPANQGVYLTRRLDYGIGNQKATVSVNSQQVGTWFTSGSDTTNRWRDSTFFIPKALTANQTSITITITFVSADVDWNEFTYQAYSVLGNGRVLTDVLNVGNSASETQHHYAISNQTWSGTRTFSYPTPDSATTDILNNTWLKISWDNETTPSVNAPIGSLFGLGQFGSSATRALMMGLDETNTLYLYFPMPFASHAHIELSNQRSSATNGINYEIQYKPFTDSFQNVGYFKTQFNVQQPTTNGNDMLILDAPGAGQFLGLVQSIDGPTSRGYLEGDERIYTDGSNSPSFQGTGTEDFYNGGWYFQNGPYSNQMSGNTVHIATGSDDKTAMYRLFLQDAVPFHTHIHVSIEHGPTDSAGINENAWALAYYYLQPARATLTDTLDVGNTTSESAHHYTISNQTWSGSQTFHFEGINNSVAVTDDGRAHKGTSQFTMAINSSNRGVILRRRFDQGILNQQAQVLVNGSLVGTWYMAGGNSTLNWREQDFLIPASFTSGKSSITITIQFVSSNLDWNEFHYWVYSES